jgi:hypothetical protein
MVPSLFKQLIEFTFFGDILYFDLVLIVDCELLPHKGCQMVEVFKGDSVDLLPHMLILFPIFRDSTTVVCHDVPDVFVVLLKLVNTELVTPLLLLLHKVVPLV